MDCWARAAVGDIAQTKPPLSLLPPCRCCRCESAIERNSTLRRPRQHREHTCSRRSQPRDRNADPSTQRLHSCSLSLLSSSRARILNAVDYLAAAKRSGGGLRCVLPLNFCYEVGLRCDCLVNERGMSRRPRSHCSLSHTSPTVLAMYPIEFADGILDRRL